MLCGGLWAERRAEERREGGTRRSCVIGSHNAERHLANKGRNNNSTEGLRRRGCLYARGTQGRRRAPQQNAKKLKKLVSDIQPYRACYASLARLIHTLGPIHSLPLVSSAAFYFIFSPDQVLMSMRGVKVARQMISGQGENRRSFNVKVGEGGDGWQVTPPLDKIK